MKISYLQYHTARTLAAALGHQWAITPLDITLPTTPDEIRKATLQATPPDEPRGPDGILAPRMDGDVVRHISASGSVRYVVHDDGSAQVILRDDVSGWHIARAYIEVAAACVALATQGRRIELSRGRPTFRDDLAWGLPADVVYMRAARHCLDTRMTEEEEAAEFFVAEVFDGANLDGALGAFLECYRCAAAWSPEVPAGAYIPRVETVARRTVTEADIQRAEG